MHALEEDYLLNKSSASSKLISPLESCSRTFERSEAPSYSGGYSKTATISSRWLRAVLYATFNSAAKRWIFPRCLTSSPTNVSCCGVKRPIQSRLNLPSITIPLRWPSRRVTISSSPFTGSCVISGLSDFIFFPHSRCENFSDSSYSILLQGEESLHCWTRYAILSQCSHIVCIYPIVIQRDDLSHCEISQPRFLQRSYVVCIYPIVIQRDDLS